MSSILDNITERIRNAYIGELFNNIWYIFSKYDLEKYRKDKFAQNELRNSFEKFLFNYYSDRLYFSPDWGGLTLFILIPPYLSAPPYKELFGVPFETPENEEQKFFFTLIKSLPFVVSNFQLPQFSAKVDEDKLINGSIPKIEEISVSNATTVEYYETNELMVYTFHKIWMDYIEDVKMGKIMPDEIAWKYGFIDYAGGAFILKFDQILELKYLGYMVGLIPNVRNPNDIVKPLSNNNDIKIVSISYNFFTYTEFTYYELAARGYTLQEPNGHPWLEKLNQIINIYTNF